MSVDTVARRVEALRRRNADRDRRAAEVRAVRHGDFDKVAPDLFSDEWPRPVVANRIDVMARHAAAALSPLPVFSCQSITSTSDRAREFADKRTRIANHYVTRSKVQSQMQSGADQFYTYGLLVTCVEPDLKTKFPHIYIEESTGVYPRWNRLGETVEVAHVFEKNVLELIDEYPEYERDLLRAVNTDPFQRVDPDASVEVVKYVSDTQVVMYLAKHSECVLVDSDNPLGRCYYVCTQKPGLDREIRGSFDDLIWVQLALHAMQTMTLSAAAQAVEAPVVVPSDVQDIPVGPGAAIRTNDPAGVRRLGLDVPQSAFASSAYLAEELNQGAITPEALGGSIDASVVTGKGVQQLMAGYSQQIANCQQSLVGHWEQVVSLCLEMDEKFWPDEDKQIRGMADAVPYNIKYRPSRDISGDYSVDVQYGGIAGLDPNRGLVFLLQALGADLVSKDLVRRNLPASFNPADEESKIAVEKMRASLLESVALYAQSIPQMAMQGQDPASVVTGMLKATDALQKGKSLEDAVRLLFPEPEPAPEAAAAASGDPMAQLAAQMGGGAAGPEGVNPAVASRGPGAKPDLAMMFAGLSSSGQPNLQAGVSRYIPAGGGV